MLIDWPVKDRTVTAETMGEHFVIHPTIMVDEDTGDLHLSAVYWDLEHRPSGLLLWHLHHEDPYEFPGEPRALVLEKVAEFVEWLESRVDCSVQAPDFTTLTKEEQMAFRMFSNSPNSFTIPKPEN